MPRIINVVSTDLKDPIVKEKVAPAPIDAYLKIKSLRKPDTLNGKASTSPLPRMNIPANNERMNAVVGLFVGCFAGVCSVPQTVQNFESSAISAPHFLHFTTRFFPYGSIASGWNP
jgi:hypothetical protein